MTKSPHSASPPLSLYIYIYMSSLVISILSYNLSNSIVIDKGSCKMQEAIPYRTSFHHNSFTPHRASPVSTSSSSSNGTVTKMVRENAVIVVGRRGCCMCHVVKRLLVGLGVNPAVYDVDDKDEAEVLKQLQALIQDHDDEVQFPAVFIGGNLFGGLDRLMASHISGELIPILKQAGALWL